MSDTTLARLEEARQILDPVSKALTGRTLGELIAGNKESPLVAIVQELQPNGDDPRLLSIAKTLQSSAAFNTLVQHEVGDTQIGNRYEKISKEFEEVRIVATNKLTELQDYEAGKKPSFLSKIVKTFTPTPNIGSHFNAVKRTFEAISTDTKTQLTGEQKILEGYSLFRLAIKESQINATSLLAELQANLDEAKATLASAQAEVDAGGTGEKELRRDEARIATRKAEYRVETATAIAQNLLISYNVSETVMAKLAQTHKTKQALYENSTIFFSTNEHVLTSLAAAYTAEAGLHEATKASEALSAGINESLETLAKVGTGVEKAALKAAYGPSINASSVKVLLDSIVSFQKDSIELTAKYKREAADNAEQIELANREAQKALITLEAKALPAQ